MPQPTALDRFLPLLRSALTDGPLTKLTLGKPAPALTRADPTLHNLFVRSVALKTGPQLTFVWRHATRDVTKNHPPAEALTLVESALGRDFLDAHLITPTQTAQLEFQPDGTARLRVKLTAAAPGTAAAPAAHNQPKHYLIPADAPWLDSLGVTNNRGQPRDGMADKFRQIQKFAELLRHLITEAFPSTPPSVSDAPPPSDSQLAARSSQPSAPDSQLSVLSSEPPPLRVIDAGSGKGYLTFAVAALLGERAHVTGIEARPELVALCNRVATQHGLAPRLTFRAGTIADTPLAPKTALPPQISNFEPQIPAPSTPVIENPKSPVENPLDLLIALHACDTATDDALARGLAAGARLLVVSPCCQKEIRPQLTAPPVLADALRHGIFQERQAEFVTDALRAQLLEWAGYKTKVFEFVSTEHTAKNLMISALRIREPGTLHDATAQRVRAFASFYGIHTHRLASHLNFPLAPGATRPPSSESTSPSAFA
jgi:SAM-dependent methyltransferase